MATRGTSKARSQEQERYIAKLYGGKVSPSSGAADTDAGDVRTQDTLIECKTTGVSGDEKRPSLNQVIEWLEEIIREAAESGYDGALALRLHAADSPLAHNGWLDIVIRHASDDANRGLI